MSIIEDNVVCIHDKYESATLCMAWSESELLLEERKANRAERIARAAGQEDKERLMDEDMNDTWGSRGGTHHSRRALLLGTQVQQGPRGQRAAAPR
jgi:hypothetical protein